MEPNFHGGPQLMTTELTLQEPSLLLDQLSSYIAQVNRIPMLTDAEELNLAERLQKEGDLEAAKRMVLSHLRYVVKVARQYAGYGLPQADLIQEGNIGLMKAVKRFDPTVGVRLVSFAVHWIKAEIHEYILKNWRIVKIATTKAQRKLFFKLRQFKKGFTWLNNQETAHIAKELNVQASTVREMESRLYGHDESFDLDATDDDDYFAPEQYLADPAMNPEQVILSERTLAQQEHRLLQLLDQLDARSQDILRSRWLQEDSKVTLHDLAEKYGVSLERIRQIEKQAMDKIKKTLMH